MKTLLQTNAAFVLLGHRVVPDGPPYAVTVGAIGLAAISMSLIASLRYAFAPSRLAAVLTWFTLGVCMCSSIYLWFNLLFMAFVLLPFSLFAISPFLIIFLNLTIGYRKTRQIGEQKHAPERGSVPN